MDLILFPLLLMIFGAIGALIFGRSAQTSALCGAGGAVSGSVIALIPACTTILQNNRLAFSMPWNLPGAACSLGLDPLSAFFLLPILILAIATALFGIRYLDNESAATRSASWFFFGILVSSMVLLVVSRNALVFLIAWEIMSLSSLALVLTHHSRTPQIKQAGWLYAVATHAGTAFLIGMFAALSYKAGSMEFSRFAALPIEGLSAGLLFGAAVIGFGCKAGFIPFHVWLPEAHPAAPSHISALMSGVMIKMGIYGLIRTLTFLGAPPLWWGIALIVLGAISGIGGILYALCQRDLKRLLAYSSVENIGIIALGLGMGLIGISSGHPLIAFAGFAGALLHILNHACFKGLLFLCAGSLLHTTGTTDIEKMGGVLKRMPWTGPIFMIGAVAICGLPPLNGFVSELMLFWAGFGAIRHSTAIALGGAMTVAALGLIGGLALTCFTKAFGVIFLGEPRSECARTCHEMPWPMIAAQALLAAACVAIAAGAPFILERLPLVTNCIYPLAPVPLAEVSASLVRSCLMVLSVCLVFGAGTALFYFALRSIVTRHGSTRAGTWDCGYARPTSRMQYSGSSFSQPVVDFFGMVLRPRYTASAPTGSFPRHTAFEASIPDLLLTRCWAPLYRRILGLLGHVRWLQSDRINAYVMYIALAMIITMVAVFWRLG